MKLLAILVLTASVAFGGMVYPPTQSTDIPKKLGNVDNPDRSFLLRSGWRDFDLALAPAVADGYTRLSWRWEYGQPDDGTNAVFVPFDRLTADIDAEAAAIKAAPIIYDRPIQAVVELPVAPDHAYRLFVDTNTGEALAIEIQSDRLSEIAWAQSNAVFMAERLRHRERIAAIQTDLGQVEDALDQIDVSATGTVGLAIASTTGANRTALQEVRKVLVDVKGALKNLRQAAEKVRREIR